MGHQKGINCLDFYPGADKPYLATGSDDFVPPFHSDDA